MNFYYYHHIISIIGTGDGLYLKDGGNQWVKKADWFVNSN